MFELDDLLTPPFDVYRPVVAAGLVRFVELLPPARKLEILQALGALGADPAEEDRLLAVAGLCPTLHKLGQVVARDRRLSETFKERLQRLESLPASTPLSDLVAAIEAQVAQSSIPLRLGRKILAEGSVAAVLTARYGKLRAVAKILKPGIRERLHEELAIWPQVAAFVEQLCRELDLVVPPIEDVLAEVSDLLLHELDLENEQRNMELAHRAFDRNRHVVIPQVLDGSTASLTLMSRIEGKPLGGEGRHVRLPSEVRAKVSRRIVEALIAAPLFEAQGESLFHADPHAGNLMWTRDGRLALLDWSLASELEKRDRVDLVKIIVGGLTLDRGRIRRAITRLAEEVLDRRAVEHEVAAAVRQVRHARLPGLSWFLELVDRLVTGREGASPAVRFPARLLLMRKSLVTLEGVLDDLGGASWDRVLVGAALVQALRDWPKRSLSGPLSRGFGTQLSNAEVLALLGSGPATAVRFWWQTWSDWARSAPE